MKRFTIRTIFIGMIMVAVGLALFKSMQGQPPSYHSLEQIISLHASGRFPNGTGWEKYHSPDIEGPYSFMGAYQTNPGQPDSVLIDTKLGRRTVQLPAVKGVSYKIIWLENRKSERTMLIMSQFEQSPPNE